MDGIKYFSQDLNVEGKKIIIRLDLNVPLKNKIIQDTTRIDSVIPFLEILIKKKAKIIILSHLGRPKSKNEKALSLTPIYKYLKEKINTNIFFFMGDIDEKTLEKTNYLKNGELLLIDNIRFFQGENENSELFAKRLSTLAEIYINDAFSCSHRKQASIHAITKFIKKSFGGPLLKQEINAINSVIKEKKEPVACIIGGSKISNKINVISNLMKNVNSIIIVGAMANNFLKYDGHNIGKSLVEKDSEKIIKKIYLEAKKFACNILIPEDCIVSSDLKGVGVQKKPSSIGDNDIILDIGPKTIKKIDEVIDKSNTVLWNGPAGYFENNSFANGTNCIAKKISENTSNKSLISIIGGGDTVSAVNKVENKLFFTHLSTAGGAFLEYLEGKDLPGLSVLK
tara:strand:+ start:531 stop:1721 length:1191 start_codon:yes stop_codon:yes gene_type:complete